MPLGVQLEVVEAAYLALLQDRLDAALRQVEAFWAERGDSLTLPRPVAWELGEVPDDAIFKIFPGFPALTANAVHIAETDVEVIAEMDLVVTAYVLGATPAQANKYAKRYATALEMVLTTDPPASVKGRGNVAITAPLTVTGGRTAFVKAVDVAIPLQLTVET